MPVGELARRPRRASAAARDHRGEPAGRPVGPDARARRRQGRRVHVHRSRAGLLRAPRVASPPARRRRHAARRRSIRVAACSTARKSSSRAPRERSDFRSPARSPNATRCGASPDSATPVTATSSRPPAIRAGADRRLHRRLLVAPGRLHLCLPRRRRRRRWRLASLRGDECPQLRASCCTTAAREGIRLLLDRFHLRVRGQRPLTEADGPGVPLRANYSFSKVAGEAVCTWVAQHFEIPLTIIRICSTYGPQGGTPVERLEPHPGRGSRSGSIPTSPTTTTPSTRTTTSSSASAPWKWPPARRSS